MVPTDEEINEMIARSDDEFDLFQKMDVEREEARSRTNTFRLMQEVWCSWGRSWGRSWGCSWGRSWGSVLVFNN